MGEKSIYQELKKRVRDLEKAVSERVRRERAYLETEERYQIHFSLANDVIYTIDRDFILTSVSPNVERLLGYRADELMGRSLGEVGVIPPEYAAKAMGEIRRVLRGERIISSTYQFITRDGSVKYGEVSGVPFVCDGTAKAVISVARDITDRVEMERSLRESEERFRAIFESAQDCIFIKNTELEYVFVNPCMEKVFGFPSGEILGRRNEEIYTDGSGAESVEIDLCVLSGEVVEGEYSRTIGDKTLTFHAIKVPMRDSTGRITGLCGIARDITERKRSEELLQAKEKELAGQARYLEEMNIALRVLLDSREKEKRHARETIVSRARKVIYPYLEKIEAGSLDEESRTYLNIIRTNLDELLAPYTNPLSQHYLDFTPMEMRIADLIKQGKSTKEMAGMLNVSPFAVSFHRNNIRRKCGILNTKKNLRSYLTAIEQQEPWQDRQDEPVI
ncbi:MAG TPA: PAS domain S-box protein [Deltaproteobacteria bacterium]|nr:PAS domain S-box protein [Deltaproteobacteria bacterium]HPR56103.1 PAS domain S-box protein [Deltaproteobacteria bacterium]HXK46939.1 PAS domain S-box protein [Deltaproteobacteria bacterium]